MGPTLQALVELQDLELQIVEIRAQVRRREQMVEAQARKVEALRSALEAEEHQIRRASADFNEADLEIKARSSHIDRLREQLNGVRTNKEYAAVLSQINNEKADLTKLEARALEMMQAVDARKARLEDEKARVQTEVQRLDELRGELEQLRQNVAGRLSRLEQQRSAAADKVQPDTYQLFERLSERHEGETMAEVQRENPRRDDALCGGCHMTLRVDLVNKLRMRDEVVTCPNCGRILYLSKAW